MLEGKDFVVYKFGGTSQADATAIHQSATLSAKSSRPLAVVVSAMAKITDRLYEIVGKASRRDKTYLADIDTLRARYITALQALVPSAEEKETYERFLDAKLEEMKELLRAMVVAKHAPVELSAAVAGTGEVLQAPLFAAHLRSMGLKAIDVDSRDIIVIEENPETFATVLWPESQARMDKFLQDCDSDIEVLVFPGFVANDKNGAPATLGRNGSDFSGSIIGALLHASEITIWTDIDGVYSADPRIVPGARRLDFVSYNEAMELSNFGAKVLHPQTMAPAVKDGIPLIVRNTFNPDVGFTVISERPGESLSSAHAAAVAAGRPGNTPECIKGIATISSVALINLEGSGMVGIPGVSERLFGCLRRVQVSVIFIAQASSEHSICFAVKTDAAETSREVLNQEFFREITLQLMSIEVRKSCSVLAVVGDGMSHTPGVAGAVCAALGAAKVNIRAIAQGSSERNISLVIDQADEKKAIRGVHRSCIENFFVNPVARFSDNKLVVVGLIGAGNVGAALLSQIRGSPRNIHVAGKANSREMWLQPKARGGSVSASPSKSTEDDVFIVHKAFNIDEFVAGITAAATELSGTPVLLDCTSSETIAARYPEWLRQGISIATPNKKAFSGPIQLWREIHAASLAGPALCMHEATVGAGLPILNTLRDLIDTGDRIHKIEGIFSGTLSFLFNQFSPARAGAAPVSFSAVVAEAKRLGYTEPDPRDDLNGTDMARKVVILARICGVDADLSQMNVRSLVPEALRGSNVSIQQYMDALPSYDKEMEKLRTDASAEGKVLRYVGVVDLINRTSSVTLSAYPVSHPFAGLEGANNIIAFTTERFASPLVVQGAGAGAQVTSHGIFRDLVEIARRS